MSGAALGISGWLNDAIDKMRADGATGEVPVEGAPGGFFVNRVSFQELEAIGVALIPLSRKVVDDITYFVYQRR